MRKVSLSAVVSMMPFDAAASFLSGIFLVAALGFLAASLLKDVRSKFALALVLLAGADASELDFVA